jgi:phosphoglycolate phosphatase
MKKAVIFDFDGTIGDSFNYVYSFLKTEARNTSNPSASQVNKLRQMSMRRLALHLGVPVWKLPFTYFKGRRVMRAQMENVKIFAGMDTVIKQLHAEGVKLFVVSANSSRNVHKFLRQSDLDKYFTAVRGGAGIMGKRSIMQQLLIRYQLSKATTWCVGDETSDVVAATAVGLPCLAVTWGFADPKHMKLLEPAAIANKVSDIPKILENAWKK